MFDNNENNNYTNFMIKKVFFVCVLLSMKYLLWKIFEDYYFFQNYFSRNSFFFLN